MNLTGPARVSESSSITVNASGFGAAYAVKFEVAGVSGNVGFNIKETRGGASVSYSESMSFAGAERIDAQAQDEFGSVIARASHSFHVAASAQGRKAARDADGPGNGGGYVLNVEAPCERRSTPSGAIASAVFGTCIRFLSSFTAPMAVFSASFRGGGT